MSDPIKIAQELKSELDNLPLFQEFKRVSEQLESDQEIQELKKNIALAKTHHEDEKHKALLEQYNSHPLVVNFNSLKEEVADYLKQISKIINKK